MRARRVIRGVGAIAAGFVVLIGGLLAYHPVLGTFNRLFRMPAVVKEPFIETLSESAGEAKIQRERLVEAWRSKRSYGLYKIQKSVEGTPVGIWLITSAGRLTLVTDYTRDSYSTRAIYVSEPASAELGPPKEEEQHPLRDWFPDSEQVYIRCRLSADQIEFF